jgi:hypothetical protein
METTDMYLPFCVPSAYTMQFKVTASVYYQCPSRSDTRELPEQQFLYYNTSCESPSNINDIRPLSVPDGCTLISFRETFSRTRHTANVAITKEPPRILRASGTLDTADCTRVPLLGNRLNSSTIWEKKVIPIIECSVTPPPKTEAESSTAINMSLPNTTITVTLPKTCDTDTSNFWFKIIPIVNGVEGAVLYEQAPIQSNRAGANSVPVTKNDLTISGTYNPQIINGRVSVSVTISSPQCRR